jgi:MYXO-CTERM domain-containing protein
MKIEGTCPELGSDSYTLGLTTGDDCVQLMIEEGGPNDADGLVNGTLVDPGGFAIEYFGPPSELSEITLSRSQLTANGTDRATITVIASDSDGRRLENMTVSASVDMSGIAIGAFIESSNGIYTATLTAGNLTGSAAVVVVIDDGEANISLASEAVAVIPIVVQPPGGGGGCTVATDGSRDASLLLLLMMAGLLVARRRNQ